MPKAGWYIMECDGTLAHWTCYPTAAACEAAIRKIEWPVWQDLSRFSPALWDGEWVRDA